MIYPVKDIVKFIVSRFKTVDEMKDYELVFLDKHTKIFKPITCVAVDREHKRIVINES